MANGDYMGFAHSHLFELGPKLIPRLWPVQPVVVGRLLLRLRRTTLLCRGVAAMRCCPMLLLGLCCAVRLLPGSNVSVVLRLRLLELWCSTLLHRSAAVCRQALLLGLRLCSIGLLHRRGAARVALLLRLLRLWCSGLRRRGRAALVRAQALLPVRQEQGQRRVLDARPDLGREVEVAHVLRGRPFEASACRADLRFIKSTQGTARSHCCRNLPEVTSTGTWLPSPNI